MKKVCTLLLFLVTLISFGQTVSEINTVLHIPGVLESKSEIRIYKRYGISNTTDVFRLCEIKRGEWKTQCYTYYHPIAANDKAKFDETRLRKSNTDETLSWIKIVNLDIGHLPNMKDFQYKLKTTEIVFENGEYFYQTNTKVVSDGVSYEVFFKNDKLENHIEYGNPFSYLESYSGVNELQMFCSLINIIKRDFNMWSDGR